MQSNFTRVSFDVPNMICWPWGTASCTASTYCKMIQAPSFSGFSDPFPASVVHGKHNSLFNRNQFNQYLQLEPSSNSQKAFQIRFNSFDRSHGVFISARSNFIFFFDTLQLMPSFNRHDRCLCSAAMFEPVWICHDPLTSFSRKLASSAQTLVHDRRRSSRDDRLCSAAIQAAMPVQ